MPDAPARRPNILWICTDSQRWDTLGCYGNPHVRTPNIDRLAAGGALCENVFAQNPLCQPSRGCFLTGRYPSTNRLRRNGQLVPPDLRPITKTFAEAGYICGLAGKLHLSACDRRLLHGPEWYKTPQESWFVPMEKRVDDGYAVFHWSHAPGFGSPADAYQQWLHGKGVAFDPAREMRPTPLSEKIGLGPEPHLHQTAFCADKAAEFIELHRQTKSPDPWLMSVNIFEPHPPYAPPEEYLRPYLDRLEALGAPEFDGAELASMPSHNRAKHESADRLSTKGWNRPDLQLVRAAYWAMCDHIDHHVGRLLAALEATGQRENTLVVFMSDHGDMTGDHGRVIKGPMLYDPALRVPLIFSWPGRIPTGTRVGGLIELGDVAPTLLDAAGLPPDPAMQARSLWPSVTGAPGAPAPRDDVYAEYHDSNPDQPPCWLSMVRTATHKLVAWHHNGEGELYDLAADPGETRNLWDHPEHRELKIDMLVRLARRMAFTADPTPPRIGVY